MARDARPDLTHPLRLTAWLGLASLLLGAGCNNQARDTDNDGQCDEDCAYADLSPALGSTASFPLRGRLVEEDLPLDLPEINPYTEIAQDELAEAEVSLRLITGDGEIDLGTARSGAEGYFDARIALPPGLPSGEHRVEVTSGRFVAGEMRVKLVDPGHDDVVVRSDVDMTYLLTDFMSSEGKLRLLEQDATERSALPGMPTVYQQLRAGAEGDRRRPLVFLSGSPRFFKRTIEAKMQIDGVLHHGIVLKPFKDIVVANLVDFDVDQLVPELEEQIGYKLTWLLELRLDLPPTVPEVLMGDDTEADVVIYALYHRLTSGQLDAAAFGAELEALHVAEGWRAQLEALAPQVIAHLDGAPAPVRAIYINHTEVTGDHFPVAEWLEGGLVRYHRGAWALALDLFEEGWISAAGVSTVRDALDAAGAGGDRAPSAQDGVQAGFLDAATVERFAD